MLCPSPALRNRRSRGALSALLLCLALPLALAPLACDGDDEPPGPTMTFDEYVDRYEQAVCEWRVRCKIDVDIDTCRSWTFYDRDASYTASALAAGTIVFHDDLAPICLDEIDALSCARVDPVGTPTCPGVLEGRVAPEEPCMVAAECALDGVCGKDPSCVDMCCAGECRLLPEPVEVGGSCANAVLTCVEGAYCKLDELTFQPTVCVPRIEIGAPCDSNGSGCVAEAFCEYQSGYFCRERRPAGANCDDNYDACQEPAQCSWNGSTSFCSAPAKLGEACDPNLYPACTDLSAACNPVSGLCEYGADVGQSCADINCIGYAYCDYESGQTCRAYATVDTPCGYLNGYVACGGALQCDNDVCAAPLFTEDACEVPGTPYTSE